MAVAFDSLAYAQRLRAAGVPPEQVEAHAEATRKYIMLELVTKEDLRLALDNLTLRLTVRMGVMLAAAVGILGTLDAVLGR